MPDIPYQTNFPFNMKLNLTETCNVRQRVSLMEQELLNLPEHMRSLPALMEFVLLNIYFSE